VRQIFLDAKDDSESSIFSLGEYYPKGGANHDDYSALILCLKDRLERAIDAFWVMLNPMLGSEFMICTVPGHDPANCSSGIRDLARRLVGESRLDGTEELVRTKPIQKLSWGGSRSLSLQLGSMKVPNPERIVGKAILLLDDVTTSGNSLLAGKVLLKQAGAARVKMAALGRTVR
jgi:predicted amidophosphoribosyltransferase